jgi:hypothetical protein
MIGTVILFYNCFKANRGWCKLGTVKGTKITLEFHAEITVSNGVSFPLRM